MYVRSPSYGVTAPIWFDTTPYLKDLVTIFSTFEALGPVRDDDEQPQNTYIEKPHQFKNDVPLDEISS
jgi:hypothetical protein